MNTSDRLDKRSLLSQLENYRVIFEVNADAIEKDQHLKEEIRHRMRDLETCIKELEILERSDDRVAINQILDQANRLLLGLKGLIGQLFSQDSLPPDDNSQDPPGPQVSF